MESMVTYVKNRIMKANYSVAVDFTMGNGFDTLMLAGVAKQVYSFDIQQIALDNTRKLLDGINNVKLILASHDNFEQYVEHFDVGIFNLGYLPQGDHSITTEVKTSLVAIDKAIKAMNPGGRLFIVVYIGHVQGKEESLAIDAYMETLNHIDYNVALFKMLNKLNAPYVIEVEKR